MVTGDSVYGEKRITVEKDNEDGTKAKVEYRVWNPFRSKLAAAILGGVDNIHIAPGSKVLYLGAASGTTVSHVSDVVGKDGVVYAVEFSHRSGRDLVNVAKKRTNIVPIIEDARHPAKYRMLVGMVDVIFADVAQPDQARIVAINAHHFLKTEGKNTARKKNYANTLTTPQCLVRDDAPRSTSSLTSVNVGSVFSKKGRRHGGLCRSSSLMNRLSVEFFRTIFREMCFSHVTVVLLTVCSCGFSSVFM